MAHSRLLVHADPGHYFGECGCSSPLDALGSEGPGRLGPHLLRDPGTFRRREIFYYLQFGLPPSLGEVWHAGGFALYGGLFGLLVVWIIYYQFRPYPFFSFLDCVAPALATGLFLGCIGCFLAGCNGGLACDLPWAVGFPGNTSVYQHQKTAGLIEGWEASSLPAHPTQLYESLFGLVTFCLLLWLFKRRQWEGQVFFTGMLWYGVYRFVTEFIRADTGGLHPFGILTFSQFVSLLVISAAVGFILRGLKRLVGSNS